MVLLSLADVDKVYSCSRLLSISTHFVSYPALAQFSSSLHKFLRELGDASEDPYWQAFVRPLKRYRFDISAAPLSNVTIQEYACSLESQLRRQLANCHLVFPSLAHPSFKLLDELHHFCQEGQDQILQTVAFLAEQWEEEGERIALLIKESRLVEDTTSAISTIPQLASWFVTYPLNMREVATYRRLVVIGPPYWYPDYIFSAPRATSVDMVCYDWIRVHWEPQPAFVSPVRSGSRTYENKITHSPSNGIDEDLVSPTVDLAQVIDSARSELDKSGDDEFVEALLLVLESSQGVFIEAEGEASVLVIDLNEEARNRVRRVSYQQIEPDMYILLRTSGGGDYIVSTADRILGEPADDLRERQQTWKARLRLAVKKQGMQSVVEHLKQRGSNIASYQNVRNWMSRRSISTKDYPDFKAIMDFVELSDQADEYWQTMKTIKRAHTQAGQRIRRLLLQEVNKSELVELERSGIMEFSLPDRDAGSLTAFRILAIAPRTVEVLPNRIDDPFPLEEA
ncbi:MAG: hypothetical protein L0332_13070 [Chloroflexi bacterium]|nr:hypothetical protein [Nitrososphaera sp.]MCI0727637.1 hypothetical protein [Chloroflexota bacterium]